jgi:tripartite motif-containing protein 71
MRPRHAALAAAGALAVLVAASPAPAAYRYVDSFGRLGKGPGEFGSGILGATANRQWDDPAGIAIARNGTILVVDPSNNRVQRFTPEGRFLGRFGKRGHDKGFTKVRLTDRLFQPEGIAVDPAGAIYVADAGNDRVMKFNSRGRFRKRLAKTGSFPGDVVQPWGIAVGGGRVFVADQGNYEIDVFGTGGGFRGSFGSFGRGPGQFVTPSGVAATPGGDRVYVTDIIRHRVIMFGGDGRLLGEFGAPGTGPGQFLKPTGVALGADGSVFVTDRCNRRVEHFTPDGKFIEAFGAPELATPTFLATDSTGTVWVGDYHRVARFGLAGAIPARAAHHNDIDIQCRHVAEMNGIKR